MDTFTIKKVLYGIILLNLAVVAGALLLIFIFASMWTLGIAFESLDDRFGDSQLIIAVISAIALISTAIISVRYRRVASSTPEDISYKTVLYQPLLDDIISLMTAEEEALRKKSSKCL